MRYNIHGYRQDKAIEFKLNNDELLILRHFEDFATSGRMDSFYDEGYMYYWINYDTFLKHLPILGINKVRLGEIITHNLSTEPLDLEEKKKTYSEKMLNKVNKRKYIGVLKSKLVKNSDVGTRTYFAFTKKFYNLKPDISSSDDDMKNKNTEGGSVKIPNGFSKNTEGGSVKIPNGVRYKNRYKDSSINDSSINDSSINDSSINDSSINDSSINDSSINDSSIKNNKEVINYVNQTLGEIGPNNKLELLSYLDDGIEVEVVIKAIDIALGNGVRNYSYVRSILNRWLSEGIKKSAQLTEHLNKQNKKYVTNSIDEKYNNYNNSEVNSDGKCSTYNEKQFGLDSTNQEESGEFTDTSGIDWSKY